MKRRAYLFAFVFCALLFAGRLSAQEFTGHVTDATGAAIGKAKVTAHNIDSNVDTATETTRTGDYTIPYLKPGHYSVSVQMEGFETGVHAGINLEVGHTASVNFALKVGQISESVTVTGDQLLDFGKADTGEVVETTRVSELPLNGRDPSTLAQLSAGVNWYGGKQWTRPFDQTEGALDINGGGEGNTVLMLDGVSNESPQGNAQVAYIPPVDAVQEFKIITNPYDAQFGRGQGGVIDMTLKSGTNKLHGDVYEFARRTWMDGNTWVNNNTLVNGVPVPRSQHTQDQYGFELDGPVVAPKLYNGRDKAFFLLQFENWKETEPNTVTTSVPMAGWAGGDFSNATYYNSATQSQQPLIIYDPQTVVQDPSTGRYLRTAFSGNKIPADRLVQSGSQMAQKILSYMPAPNVAPRAGQNPFYDNYVIAEPIKTIYRNALAKLDYNLTAKDRFTLRFGYWERRGAQNSNGLSGPAADAYPNGSRNSTFATEEVHTFTPNLVLNFKAVATTFIQINLGGAQGFDQTSLGWSSSLVSQYNGLNNYFPSIGLSGFATMGNTGGNISPAYALVLNPALTWIKGKHTIHGGVDLRALQQINKQVGGGISFSSSNAWTEYGWNYSGGPTTQTGSSIASFLLGTPDSGGVSINSPVYWSRHYFAPFVQDDLKVNRKLTLNLGVRWDLNGTQSERHNRGNYAFDTTSVNPVSSAVNQSLMPVGTKLLGGMTFLGVNGAPRTFIPMIKTSVQPRIGFAYALDSKTVIRGGYGMMYRNPIPGDNNLGFSATTQYVDSFDNGIHQSGTTIDNPFPTTGVQQPTGSKLGLETGLGQSTWFINPKYKSPRYEDYSLGMERQFLKNDMVNVTYSGSRSTRQDSSDNINHVSVAAMETCSPIFGGDPNSAACGAQNANPYFDVPAFEGSSFYNSTTLPASEFSRAFPEFGDITEYQLNEGRSWYNSLQVTGTHKMGQDLTFHGTWTFSKTMNSGGFTDGNYRILSRSIDGSDITHRATLSGVYMLPIGHNRALLSNANRLVDTVVGGWELASLYIFETGHPWNLNGAGLNLLHNAAVPHRADPSIPGSIRGAAPCVAGWNEVAEFNWVVTPFPEAASCKSSAGVYNYDFIQQAPYAPNQNIVYSGIRIPNFNQIDANLSKNFHPTERFTVQLRLEGFNVPNHPVFQQNYDTNPQDSQFGTILKQWGQTNVPREGQLAVKLLW